MSAVHGEAPPTSGTAPDPAASAPTGASHDTASPSDRAHRRDSLEKHLQQRPNAQELKEKHILLDTNAAPSLQAAQHDLEKQQVTDSLGKKLEHRPEREDLVQRKSPTTEPDEVNLRRAASANTETRQYPSRKLWKRRTISSSRAARSRATHAQGQPREASAEQAEA